MLEENQYDLGLTTINDVTTNALYVYTSKTLNPDAASDSAEWVCYRVTVADGSKVFAKHPVLLSRVTNFNSKERLLKASLAATYTY